MPSNGLNTFKLNFRIVGRRRAFQLEDKDYEHVDIEWTHTSGEILDTKIIPVTHPPDEEYRTVAAGKRRIIKDMVTVPAGTQDCEIVKMMEAKREPLARSLGVEV
jgi:hypothetical protein